MIVINVKLMLSDKWSYLNKNYLIHLMSVEIRQIYTKDFFNDMLIAVCWIVPQTDELRNELINHRLSRPEGFQKSAVLQHYP